MSAVRTSCARLLRLAVFGALLLACPATALAQFQGGLNTPTPGSTTNSPFTITGWATWQNTGSGPGIDLVLIHGCLVTDCASMSFWGAATYGLSRPDVAAALGHSRYTNSGFTLTKAGLPSGTYYIAMAVRETVTGTWSTPAVLTVTFTANAVPEHTLETPTHGQALTSPVSVQGWAIDASAPSGTGVNAVSLWSHPNPGSGQAGVWIGYATYGANRADVAASHGERFRYSGYTASTTALATGANLFGVSAQSSHTQAWTSRIVTVYVNTPTVPLTIDRPGTGTGGVTASGLTCVGGSATQAVPCGANYALHSVVTLTAVPDALSTFAGWTGACTGTGTCRVTLSQARFVAAVFTKVPSSIDTRYYHTDVIGSVRAITKEDGAVVARNDYRPFGEDVAPLAGDPNRFAGKQLDPETALHYFDARYYRNTWGRFTSVDPLQVGAAMTDPQQWNRYAYARNNPLAYGDPTGLCAVRIDLSPGATMCAETGVSAGGGHIDSLTGGLGGVVWGNGMDCGGPTPEGYVPRIQDGNCYGWEYVGVEPPSYDDQGAEQTVPSSGTTGGNGNGNGNGGNGNGGNGNGNGNNGGTTADTPVARKLLGCTAAQLGVDELYAFLAVQSGRPIEGSKRFRTPGSSKGTSLAAKVADGVLGKSKLPVSVPVLNGGPTTGIPFKWAWSDSAARVAGRAVPWVGWGMLAWDAVSIASCTFSD